MKSIKTPRSVALLLKRAKLRPVSVSPLRLDLTSAARKQTLPAMPVGEALALFAMCSGSHDLQRDTLGRLANTKKTAYLRNAEEVPTPQQAVQFVYFRERLEALDGNHRMTLWSREGEVSKVPATVDVTIHYPQDEAEYNKLYRCIDSTAARKTNSDNLYGIFHAIGLTPTSELFKSQKLVSAIQFVGCTGNSLDADKLLNAARSLQSELKTLDGYGFHSAQKYTYSSGVWAGLLILMKEERDLSRVGEFAAYLRLARLDPTSTIVPQSVNRFLTAYRELNKSASGMSSVVKLLKDSFNEFEESAYPKLVVRRTRRTA